jgi:hypothetical protein
MPSGNSKFRPLVKTAPGPNAVRLSLDGQRFGFSMTSLRADADAAFALIRNQFENELRDAKKQETD